MRLPACFLMVVLAAQSAQADGPPVLGKVWDRIFWYKCSDWPGVGPLGPDDYCRKALPPCPPKPECGGLVCPCKALPPCPPRVTCDDGCCEPKPLPCLRPPPYGSWWNFGPPHGCPPHPPGCTCR